MKWLNTHHVYTASGGHAGVPGVKPVIIELTDVKTKEKVDEIEVDACLVATGRAPYTHVSCCDLLYNQSSSTPLRPNSRVKAASLCACHSRYIGLLVGCLIYTDHATHPRLVLQNHILQHRAHKSHSRPVNCC